MFDKEKEKDLQVSLSPKARRTLLKHWFKAQGSEELAFVQNIEAERRQVASHRFALGAFTYCESTLWADAEVRS